METSKKSTGETLFDLTYYAADIPVSPLATQENAKVKTTLDTCGLGFEKPLANYDPNTQSWKTYGDTYLWGDSPSLENLPKSGMTQNGELFLQPAWEPITAETALSSWPTPTTMDHLPPRSEQALERQQTNNRPGRTTPPTLKDAVAYPRMWPTPTVSNWMIATSTEAIHRHLENHLPSSRLLEEVAMEQPDSTGFLNPMWVEWLMGFPLGWTDLEDSETL
jgi:hypothetical protein